MPTNGEPQRSRVGRLLATAVRPRQETDEQFVGRIPRSPAGGFIGRFIRPLVPPVVELYDRIESLERRVRALEQGLAVVTADPDAGETCGVSDHWASSSACRGRTARPRSALYDLCGACLIAARY